MKPVVRSLRILRTVANSGGGLTLQDMAHELDLPLSTVHRLAGVLEDEAFLTRTPRAKRYVLGPAVRSLMSRTETEHIREVARPAMWRLRREYGEAVYLAELIGAEVICVDHLSGTGQLRLFVELGRSMPLHASASARVILAMLDDDIRTGLLDHLDMPSLTEQTITTATELNRRIGLIRRRGYDISERELDPHGWAVAAPLRNADGTLYAAITVVAPESNVAREKRRSDIQNAVVTAAKEISVELGAAAG